MTYRMGIKTELMLSVEAETPEEAAEKLAAIINDATESWGGFNIGELEEQHGCVFVPDELKLEDNVFVNDVWSPND